MNMIKSVIVVNKYKHKELKDFLSINCMRGSILGNPYVMKHRNLMERNRVIVQYKQWLWRKMNDVDNPVKRILNNLAVYNGNIALECCCHPLPCHCDVIKAAIEWLRKNQ